MPLSLSSLGEVGWSDLQGGGWSLLGGGCVHKVGENLCLVEKEFKSLSLVLCLWKKREDRGKRERRSRGGRRVEKEHSRR